MNGHGSHVAGIIGASDNRKGIVGVAPHSYLHIIRVGDERVVYKSNILMALAECREVGAHVINMSFGTLDYSNITNGLLDDLYLNENIVLVSASGNRGDANNEITYPSGYDSVISVSASNQEYQIASFSSYNSQVSLSGPGVEIASLGASEGQDDFSYDLKSGTSMSSPHVAGVAALLKSIFPASSSQLIRKTMEYTADGLSACDHDLHYGHGHVNAFNSARMLMDLIQSVEAGNTNDKTFAKPACHNVSIELNADEYPDEIFWYVTNNLNMPIVHGGKTSGLRNFQIPEITTSVSRREHEDGDNGENDFECFTFVITDTYGDG